MGIASNIYAGCSYCGRADHTYSLCPERRKQENVSPTTHLTPPDPCSYSAGVHKTEPALIADVLKERGAKYGDFNDHSRIAQTLKAVVMHEVLRRPGTFNNLHLEALDMIMHKIGRILNGDPNYADSWIDIAGYAQLVVDRLPK